MKKLLAVLAITLVTSLTFGQTDSSHIDCPKCPSTFNGTPYIGLGISIPNTTNFSASSYASIEAGVMFENLTVAGAFGVNNLDSFRGGINNYWYEGKVAYSFPLGVVDGYGVFGIGSYIGTKGSVFIEYGGGISKTFGDFGVAIGVSSWDGIIYMSPSVSYSF